MSYLGKTEKKIDTPNLRLLFVDYNVIKTLKYNL